MARLDGVPCRLDYLNGVNTPREVVRHTRGSPVARQTERDREARSGSGERRSTKATGDTELVYMVPVQSKINERKQGILKRLCRSANKLSYFTEEKVSKRFGHL